MLSKTFTMAVALLLCFQCAKSPSLTGAQGSPPIPKAQGAARVTKGEGKFALVNFPDWFFRKDTTPRGEKIIIATGHYEVRKLADPSSGELVFAAKDDDDDLSANHFAVSLDGRFAIRTATMSEWNKAEKAAHKRYDPFAHETKVNGDVVEFHGRSFKKTGQTWETTAALPSLSGKWIVVFSHTSEKDNPSNGLIGGGGRGKGEMFIDVYNTATGEEILSGSAPHGGGDEPMRHFNETFWVGDLYLIVPLDTQAHDANGGLGNSCFLGILPQ